MDTQYWDSYLEGQEDFRNGKLICDFPYDPNMEFNPFRGWIEGFVDASRGDVDRFERSFGIGGLDDS